MNHYQIVKEVINDWDPKNLLRYTSEEEYDPEISRIVLHYQQQHLLKN